MLTEIGWQLSPVAADEIMDAPRSLPLQRIDGPHAPDLEDDAAAASTRGVDTEYLRNRKVCVTGRLFSMTHSELAVLVKALGGIFLKYPTRSSFLLLIGDDGWPSESDGSPSRILDRAQRLRAYGYRIDFASEDEFLERVGFTQPAGAIRGQHTISDLARMLNLSAVRIRRWLQIGLIEPARTVHRLAYFDFRAVAFAKRLSELLAGGASLQQIQAGMAQMRMWLASGKLAADQLAGITADGRILLRLQDRLMDGHGQSYFDFEDHQTSEPAVRLPTFSRLDEVSQLFEAAIAFEDAGELEEAARAYARAVHLEPTDPVLHFNLGNALFNLREVAGSIESFRQAVGLDAEYAEAWNNLGNALAEKGEWQAATAALERAIQLVPSYADAHFNLAEILERLGTSRESVQQHWRAYQQYSAPRQLQIDSPCLLRLYRDEGNESAEA